MGGEQEQRQRPERKQDEATEGSNPLGKTAVAGAGEKTKAELDDLLDSIDEALEENAEEFVRSYVQKGGE